MACDTVRVPEFGEHTKGTGHLSLGPFTLFKLVAKDRKLACLLQFGLRGRSLPRIGRECNTALERGSLGRCCRHLVTYAITDEFWTARPHTEARIQLLVINVASILNRLWSIGLSGPSHLPPSRPPDPIGNNHGSDLSALTEQLAFNLPTPLSQDKLTST